MSGRLHMPIFLLALSIAVVIKIAVHEEVQLSERTITAKAQYNVPAGVTTLNRREEFEVKLRGKRTEMEALIPQSVVVEVTLAEGELGHVPVTRDRLNVRVPGDLEVISIDPNRFTLEVEHRETVTLPIRVRFTGEPSAGAVPGSWEARPALVRVSGPSSRIQKIREVTAWVNLEGHAVSFTETVAIESPDDLVRVEPTQVVIEVPMELRELSTSSDDNPREESRKP